MIATITSAICLYAWKSITSRLEKYYLLSLVGISSWYPLRSSLLFHKNKANFFIGR